MKASIENNLVYSEFLPMRGDKLETSDGNITVAGVSAAQVNLCGNLTGMRYLIELVGREGRFQWRRKNKAAEVEPEPSLDESFDPDWKNG